MIYFHYIRHYYNECGIDEIDTMCDVFAENVISDTFPAKQQIVSKMKETNHNMDNMVSQLRSDSIPYDMALSSVIFLMFQLSPKNDQEIEKISLAAKHISDYRTEIEETVLRKKASIIDFVNTLYKSFDKKYHFKKRQSKYPEEYTKGMLLFCMKYFGRHYCSPDMFLKYPQREYISQHFIKLVILDLFKDKNSVNMCYTMWNHLCKLYSPEDISKNKENILLKILITNLMMIEVFDQNEKNLTMEVYHMLAEALNTYEFHF